jgi:hypothetical protein
MQVLCKDSSFSLLAGIMKIPLRCMFAAMSKRKPRAGPVISAQIRQLPEKVRRSLPRLHIAAPDKPTNRNKRGAISLRPQHFKIANNSHLIDNPLK